jgi:pimeloyl-ACP methyl ester carboxylesterase
VLPLTPAPLPSERSGQADVNGISIHYAIYGEGSPVIMLHGGMANADYWGHQIPALAPRHTVIVMDSRVARPLGSTWRCDTRIESARSLPLQPPPRRGARSTAPS